MFNLQSSMTLDDKLIDPASTGARRQPVPTKPVDEAPSARKGPTLPPAARRPGAAASPSRRPAPQRRPRRNSDSSVLDFDSMPLTEEEKRIIARRRERERQKREGRDTTAAAPATAATDKAETRDRREGREREGREREGRDREGKSRSKSGRPNRRVDIIDQLDATGIYGTGRTLSPLAPPHLSLSTPLSRVAD